jgi:hypothetical protein
MEEKKKEVEGGRCGCGEEAEETRSRLHLSRHGEYKLRAGQWHEDRWPGGGQHEK